MIVMEISLGERLRILRKRADLSQEQLAEKSGITTSLVAKLEQGRTANPGIDTVRAIARALKVRIVDLVGEEDWACDGAEPDAKSDVPAEG